MHTNWARIKSVCAAMNVGVTVMNDWFDTILVSLAWSIFLWAVVSLLFVDDPMRVLPAMLVAIFLGVITR